MTKASPELISNVGNSAIKIACLQVKPGYEFSVVSSLEKACKDNKDIVNHAIIKGFGHYDVILIYEGASFEYRLTSSGPIPGILSSNTYLCFPYLGSNTSDFFNKLKKSLFVGLSLLKYNTSSGESILSIEKKLISHCKAAITTPPEFLGTIGWNEVILLLFSDDIQDVVTGLLKLNYKKNMNGLIEKTYSTVGIQHNILPACEGKNIPKIEKELAKYPGLSAKISDKLLPIIKISAKPAYYDEITTFWKDQEFKTREILGTYDIACELLPRPETTHTWSLLLACLLFFRCSFKDRIKSTFTSIEFERSIDLCIYKSTEISQPDIPQPSLLNDSKDFTQFSINELNVFGRAAPLLANHIYTLNSLRQHPISGKAFSDMGYYPRAIINLGNKLRKSRTTKNNPDFHHNQSKSLEDIGLQAAYAIASGCQLRSYGTYGNIERPHGGFSKLRGGAQRALLATHFLPASILYKLGLNWEGFIIVEEPKFSHINEVISVPSEALWRPQTWWAIVHETGHVFFTKVKWIDEEEPVVQKILTNKSKPNIFFDFLLELGAEIFGYKIGFFNNFNLYLEVLLEYLVDIEPTQNKHFDMSVYLLRTFFVEMYSERFDGEKISDEEFYSEEYLFNRAVEHIDKATKIIDNRLIENNPKYTDNFIIHNKYFLAASYAVTMKELTEFAAYLNNKVTTYGNENPFMTKSHDHYFSDTIDAFNSIKKGQVWWGTLPHPEALLYRLILERKNLEFCSSISAVLTYWNQTN